MDLEEPSASVPACPLNLTLPTELLISEDVASISSALFVLMICEVPSKASNVLPSVVPCAMVVLNPAYSTELSAASYLCRHRYHALSYFDWSNSSNTLSLTAPMFSCAPTAVFASISVKLENPIVFLASCMSDCPSNIGFVNHAN